MAAGFAKFLNENSPSKDDFWMLVALMEGFSALLKFPFDKLKDKFDEAALEHATEEQKKEYTERMNERSEEQNKQALPPGDSKTSREKRRGLVNSESDMTRRLENIDAISDQLDGPGIGDDNGRSL